MALLFAECSAQCDMELVTRVDLAAYIHEARPIIGARPHEVSAIAFSPDGRRIAFAAGFHDMATGPVMHIFSLDLPDLKQSFQTPVAAPWAQKLQWSSDNRLLLVQSFDGTWLLDSRGEALCRVGDRSSIPGGFVSAGLFAVVNQTGHTTSMRFFDTHCSPVSETVMPFNIRSVDTSDAAMMMAVTADIGGIRLVHGPDWATVATIYDPRPRLDVKMFNNGKIVCAGPGPGPGDATFRCWNAGAPIPPLISSWPSHNAGTEPAAAAADVPLVAFGDWSFSYNALSESRKMQFKRWIIWDARRGVITEQLPGRLQVWRYGTGKPGQKPYVSALSANGKLFAIGGDGMMEIYTLGTGRHTTGGTSTLAQ